MEKELFPISKYWGIKENQAGTGINKEQQYDKLAELVRENLNMKEIYRKIEAGV